MRVFIPLKGSSERVPNKNTQLVGGKPLWRWVIDELLPPSPPPGELSIHIDTDCEVIHKAISAYLIAREVEESKVTIGLREPRFIQHEVSGQESDSPIIHMLLHWLNFAGVGDDETVALVHVTSPFLKLSTLVIAEAYLSSGSYNSVQSVSREQTFGYVERAAGYEAVNFREDIVQKTQDLQPLLLSRAAFFLFTAGKFKEAKTRNIRPMMLMPLHPIEGVEIDYPADLELARVVAKGLQA